MLLFCRFLLKLLTSKCIYLLSSISIFFAAVMCVFNPLPRVRIGLRVTRGSCRWWSRMNRRKLLLSLSKKVSVLPNWIPRASPRESLTSLLGDQYEATVCGSNLLSPGRFHLCVSQGRLDCLEVIIAHGADLTVTESAGRKLKAVEPLGVSAYS